ncbi:hypothetical protein QKW60_05710 [Defluviimonas aestuarii]|nr:hypothetical protein [Defluviimonas aestuarii]MDI3335893.1 hypothetical protein [Defluviimonas aestuarii]
MIGGAIFTGGLLMVGAALSGGQAIHARPGLGAGLVVGGFVLALLSGVLT